MTCDELKVTLIKQFHPLDIHVKDESHLHARHKTPQKDPDNGGHFQLRMVSAEFEGKSLVERHRAVYAALGMPRGDIHALRMTLLTPAEVDPSVD